MRSAEAQKHRSTEAGKGGGRVSWLKPRFFTSALLCLCTSALICAGALSCSSPTAFTAGNLTEPQGVAIAVPAAGADALPRTFAYVTDAAKDTIKVVDVSLRSFVEAPIPYFPLMIPVGSRPTRLCVSPDNQTLYVLNAVSRDISVVDTSASVEIGAAWWDGTTLRTDDPATGGPRRIQTGLVMTDLAAAFSAGARADRLYVAADAGDGTGVLIVYDAAKAGADGKPNPAAYQPLRSVALPGIPGRISVSADGDTVWLSNRTGKTVIAVDMRGGTLTEVDLGAPTEFVKVIPSAGPNYAVYAGSKDARGVWIIDAATRTPRSFDLSPGRSLGTMLPVSFGVPQHLALAPATSLGTTLSSDAAIGCPGTAGLMTLVSGQIAAMDVSGCGRYTDAKGDSYIGKDIGMTGLFVESDTTSPYISVPAFSTGGRTLTQDEQGFAQYPRIDGWNRSENNYGVTMSKLFRQFLNKASGYVTYEGVVFTGAAGAFTDAATFGEAGKDFEAARVSAGEDVLVLTNADGTPRTACDAGAVAGAAFTQGEFPITAVQKGTLTIAGTVPDATCIKDPFAWEIRAKGAWTIIIESLGLIGRAAEGQTFLYPPDPQDGTTWFPHLKLTMRSGTQPSTRDMIFSFQIYFFAMSLGAAEQVLMPTDIAVAEDSINPYAAWAFVVYAGSSALYQFEPRTLDANVSILYR